MLTGTPVASIVAMRNLRLLAVSCLLVSCGQVTALDHDAGTGAAPGSGDSGSGGGAMPPVGGAGSGGNMGSGGTTGSGGNDGSGGVTGSGGNGGHPGSGGNTGSGGSPGSGGGGVVDAGSDAPDAGDPCLALRVEYDAAFKQARMCNLAADAPQLQCQATASPSLPCPNCVQHVQSTTKLDEIRARWNAMKCPSGPCPAIACILPGTGACAADSSNPSSTVGTCTDLRITPL